jgi:hypothetical protein
VAAHRCVRDKALLSAACVADSHASKLAAVRKCRAGGAKGTFDCQHPGACPPWSPTPQSPLMPEARTCAVGRGSLPDLAGDGGHACGARRAVLVAHKGLVGAAGAGHGLAAQVVGADGRLAVLGRVGVGAKCGQVAGALGALAGVVAGVIWSRVGWEREGAEEVSAAAAQRVCKLRPEH